MGTQTHSVNEAAVKNKPKNIAQGRESRTLQKKVCMIKV